MGQTVTELLTHPAFPAFLALAYTVLQIGGIAAAVHAVFNSRSAQGATAWAIALVTAPVIMLPFYLIFGRNRFGGYVDARRSADSRQRWITDKALEVCGGYRSNLPDPGGRLSSLERLARLPFTYGNHIEVLVDGEAAFEAMFAAIERAERYVLIQFFIVRDDELGERLKNLLISKAQAGVRVYFLYDRVGSHGLSMTFIRDCRLNRIRIEPFQSSRAMLMPLQINFRNHRKTLVVDGDFAFLGGMNVGVEYLGRDARVGRWRDTHAAVEGPAADAVQLIFAEDWHWATHESIECLEWKARLTPDAGMDALIVPSGPSDELETCSLMFVHAIHSAERRFWIASPYFVPNAEVVSALQIAGLRGVDVRILLPANPDHVLVYLASFYYMKLAGGPNVRFYRYNEGFMHQKAFLIDDFGVGIGTANLDNRSFRLNFELTLLSVNVELAREVEAMFEEDFAKSTEVAHDAIDQRNIVFRVGAAGARLLSPVL